ncbi:hypothetical protein [Aridibaculum aurantiacum]|uniref:hypothetical protein n=1 Tax=Aridibaculum aurantiacum TaxID=2810307 RepID=UPI001A978757|nr:hypothetical protein [Aridibaculum aurantiacum]
MKQEQNPNGINQITSDKKPLTISELAKRHLFDPNHSTTDEEMRNAQLELTGSVGEDKSLYEIDNTTLIPPTEFETKAARESEDDDDNDSGTGRIPNPYDVLG